MRRTHLWMLPILLTGLYGCPEPVSSGQHANSIENPTQFVTEQQPIYVSPHNVGISEIQLDGTGRRDIYDSRFSFRSVSDDGSVWAVNDDNRHLHVVREGEFATTPVHELDFPVSAAIVSPDQQTLAVTRQRVQTGAPQDRPPGDDAIYLVDVETFDIQTFEATTEGDITLQRLHWSRDGASLYYLIRPDDRAMRLDVDTGERMELDDWERYRDDMVTDRRRRPVQCPHTPNLRLETSRGEHDGLVISQPGHTRELVTIEDFNPGRSADTRDLIDAYFFSDSCDYAVYVYNQSVWVVDVSSGVVGKLMDGQDAFSLGFPTE